MWSEKRGIVSKINEKTCIIITPEGTYKKIPLPAQSVGIGAEIAYRHTLPSSKLKPLLMAASFLILFISYALLHQAFLPRAVAYVSLDINPSLELSIDKNLVVIEVRSLNDDASLLVKQVPLKGKGLNDALSALIKEAIKQNYIKSGQDNLIISTVTPVGNNQVPIDEQQVCQLMVNSVNSGGISGQVKVYSASNAFRTAAENNNLSPGKYLIYQQLLKAGNKVSIDEVKKDPIRNLVNNYKIEMLPNFKKISIEKSPRNIDPEIEVDDNGQNVPIEEYIKKHQSGNENNVSTPENRQDSQRHENRIKENGPQNNRQGNEPREGLPKNSQGNKASGNHSQARPGQY